MDAVSSSRVAVGSAGHALMRESSVRCANAHGFYRMAYSEWGDRDNPRVLVCVHGLTRNGRDFDYLARALEKDFRIVCPDVVGRGRSDWLKDASGYQIPAYVNDMVTLIARLNVETVSWVGSSMGGLMGMALAAMPGSPVVKLVLNDVGPVITTGAISRIGDYVGRAPKFGSIDEAEHYVRLLCASFGPLTDEQWRHITVHALKECGDGFEMRYDPAIGDAFRATPLPGGVDLWPMYEAISCPVMVLRGTESDLLSPETVRQMTERGPRAQAVDIPHAGHAPMLMDEHQIGLVRRFLG